MAGVGGIGGAGGVGGLGVGGMGGASVGPPAAGTATAASNASGASEGVKVSISAAGRQMSLEATQVGASFSVSKDGAGHHYVNGTDANGFKSPDSVSPTHNANGQSYAELNKLDDMVAMALLALLLGDKKENSDAMSVLAGAQAVQAINSYMAVSQM